jgi:hypothetical protein
MGRKAKPLTDRIVDDIDLTGPGTAQEVASCFRIRLKRASATLSNLTRAGRLVVVGRFYNTDGNRYPAPIYGTPSQARQGADPRGLSEIFRRKPA